MLPRPVAVLVLLCAIGWAGAAGCAKKRANVEPLPPVTVAKSYPGKAAVEAMRDAIGKLRKKPERRAGAAKAAPRSREEQPVGTAGGDAATTQPPRAASSMGRETAPPVPGPRVTPADQAATNDTPGRMDPLAALIVGAWIALLVLLPLAIRYGWRG